MHKPTMALFLLLAAIALALGPAAARVARAANPAAGLYREQPEQCLIGGKLVRCPIEPEERSPEDRRAAAAARALDAAILSLDAVDRHPWPTGSTGPTQYTVQDGDTLWDISVHFGISVEMILSANDLGPYNILSPGEALDLPASNERDAAVPGRDGPVVKGSGLHFVASISRQHCWLFRDAASIGDWTCSTGRDSSPSIPGNYTVQSKVSRAYFAGADSWMPYWLGIYDAPGQFENGIHGVPYARDTGEKFWTDKIGEPVTFGCVMLEDAVLQNIWQVAYVGMPVTILR